MRIARNSGRYLLWALATMGLLASARFAIAPPHAVVPHAPRVDLPDPAAEGYACLFTRSYLGWDARNPEAHQHALTSFVGPSMDFDAGLQPPSTGEQRVLWAQVVQRRVPTAGEHVYTVAAQTDRSGLVYISVTVLRKPSGALALGGYPAFVGPPAASAAQDIGERLHDVSDPALVTVVQRTLRNYLAASASELAADLTSGARVSLPGMGLSLGSVQWQRWAPDRRSVHALAQAQDARGTRYTLAYELDVSRAHGRWEVSAIQTDPDA
ncbi:MAG TPA: hypothetical protein VLJ42_06505 [Solirubrobacteraceae bacterium]|nr:hypothetical protein [Solirubrobacteraceae bacterium]